MQKPVEGFSKFSKEDKLNWVAENYTKDPEHSKKILERYWNSDSDVQKVHDEFIENTLTNYYLPFSIAPNFLIDNDLYALPMVIEESSVVAAVGKAAKFWLHRGGFITTILGTEKVGQVHFFYEGDNGILISFFERIKTKLIQDSESITKSMQKRGGGITAISLKDKTQELSNYYQLHCTFETLDAMGANFINSCLEQFAKTLQSEAEANGIAVEVTMSILSNYVPNCLVRAEVSCSLEDLEIDGVSGTEISKKFIDAIAIAKTDPHRAVTHNKGVMNGVDALILATGNDFRAVEAGVHAYASKEGQYSSLTHAEVKNDQFRFWIELPLALGTVGGLTSLHPMVKLALEILKNPTAEQLMRIVAVAGLAQNFAALRSLVTTGIQKGHMKMHLLNLLNQVGATEAEKKKLAVHFTDKTISNSAVKEALQNIRN